MSWGIDLWDQYDSVGKHTEKGIDFLDKYSHFLKKRCEIEVNYAGELKKLVRAFQPKKKEEDDYQFTWARSFLDMLKELHDLAGQHEVIAENTQSQLVHEIQKCVSELKTERKKLLQEGTKCQGQLKDSLKLHENAKRNYEKKYSEAERSLDIYRRSDADINLSRAEVEKTRALSNKRSSEAEESKNEYASQLQNTNKFQRDFYTSHMPTVFQQLQDLDERRINKIKSVIKLSANIEQGVLPIISTCNEGMVKSSDAINATEDSGLVIEKYRTGFPLPGDIPFDDLANGQLNNSNNVIHNKQTPDKGTLKAGTIGGKKSKRSGLLGLFKSSNTEEQREDFGNIPPAQRKAKLLKKIDELRKSIAHETAEREGMLKMREVYENNPALGDANTLNKKVEQNAEKLNSLQTELRKYQEYLADAEGNDMNMKRHGSDDSMTPSITSEGSNNGPGTPQQQHTSPEEYYEKRASSINLAQGQGLDKRATSIKKNGSPVNKRASSVKMKINRDSVTISGPVEEPPPIEPTCEMIGTPDPVDDEFAYPVIGTCSAIYPFDAVNDGSVNMSENEEMWVLEQDQGDGWTRVRKNDGASSEGFVPTSYIQCHFYDQDAV